MDIPPSQGSPKTQSAPPAEGGKSAAQGSSQASSQTATQSSSQQTAQASGQPLTAKVLQVAQQTQGNANARPQYQVLLQVANQSYTTVSSIPLSVGDLLNVQWKNDNTLSVMALVKPSSQDPLAQLSRLSLAHQQSPSATLNALAILVKALNTLTQSNPAGEALSKFASAENQNLNQLQQTISQILSRHFNPSKPLGAASGQQLQQLFQASGVLFEKKLLSDNPKGAALDNKGQLGNLLAALKSASEGKTQSVNTNTATDTRASNTDAKPNNQPVLTKLLNAAAATLKTDQQGSSPTSTSTASQTSSLTAQALIKITQALLLDAMKLRPEHQLQQLKPAELQAFAQFLAGVIRDEQNTQSNRAKDKNDQILQSLLKNIASSLFRVQWNQLNSLPQSSDERVQQQWQFDLPLFADQSFQSAQVKIKKEEAESKDAEQKKQIVWRVNLDFDFEAIGAMHVELLMKAEDAKATLWSQQQATYEKTKLNLSQLQEALLSIGFSAVEVFAEHGLPPQSPTPPISKKLIDVRT